MRQDAGLLQPPGEPGEAEEHRDDLRVGPPGHWIHAGTVYFIGVSLKCFFLSEGRSSGAKHCLYSLSKGPRKMS